MLHGDAKLPGGGGSGGEDEGGCLPATGYSVDILLRGKGVKKQFEQGVAVEVDGPRHFVAHAATGAASYAGFTVLKHRLLRSTGLVVVSVPYFQWQRAKSRETRALLIRNLLAPYIEGLEKTAAPGDEEVEDGA